MAPERSSPERHAAGDARRGPATRVVLSVLIGLMVSLATGQAAAQSVPSGMQGASGVPRDLGRPPTPPIGRGTIFSEPIDIRRHDLPRGCMIERCHERRVGREMKKICHTTFWTVAEMERYGVPPSECR